MVKIMDRIDLLQNRITWYILFLAATIILIVSVSLIITKNLDFPPTLVAKAKTIPLAGQSNTNEASAVGFTKPLFISLQQYASPYNQELLDFRPLDIRAIAAGPYIDNYDIIVQRLASIEESGLKKLIGFSSYRDLEEKLSQAGPPGFETHADYLLSIGVTGFTYNTEINPQGIPWTPQDEMDNIFSTDPQTNSVAKFAHIARSYGFNQLIWVPYRHTADGYATPGSRDPYYAEAFRIMYQSGLSGVGLQEQNYIGQECAEQRANAFYETLDLHTTAANGSKPLILVNFYLEKCTEGDEYARTYCGLPQDHYPWQHCDEFVDLISANLNILSIPDQPSEQLIDLFDTIRGGSPLLRIYLPVLMSK